MKWVPLDSSVFLRARYIPAQRILDLRFRSDETYRYFDVPTEEYRAFLTADSHGRYFAAHIRDKYRCERLAKLRLITKRARG